MADLVLKYNNKNKEPDYHGGDLAKIIATQEQLRVAGVSMVLSHGDIIKICKKSDKSAYVFSPGGYKIVNCYHFYIGSFISLSVIPSNLIEIYNEEK